MNSNMLQQQVEKILRDKDWKVSSEDFYTDPNTNKPREKDIIAKKYQSNYDYDIVLFIECKTIPEDTVIEEKEKNNNEENMTIATNIPHANIGEIENNEQLHLCQYQKFFKSKDTRDFLHTAVNQNLQSSSAFRENHKSGIYYLIIVYDSNVFYLDDKNQKQVCDRALIKVGAIDNIFNLPNKKCFIEIVSISEVENLLQDIEDDLIKINRFIGFYRRMEQNKIEQNRRNIMNDNYGFR